MAFLLVVYKAYRVQKYKKLFEEEKHISIKTYKNKNQLILKERYRHFFSRIKRLIQKKCRKTLWFKKDSFMYRTCYNLREEESCENFALKSLLGFIGGFLLTYIFFMFFIFQLSFKLSSATILCSIFGIVLTIGLAFSYKVRCVVFMLLPQFFSKRGRQALLAYAFLLALTGPAKNTLHNMGILSESLACGQQQLKSAVSQIMEIVKKPFYALKESLKQVVKTVKEIVRKIKQVLLAIKRLVMALLSVIQSAFEFLGKVLSMCNKELGTPFQRCSRVFDDAVTDCNARLGPLFGWLCSITYLVKSVCYIVKPLDFICMLVDFVHDSVIGVVKRKIKVFVRHMQTMFYVRIKFSHSFHFETTQSKNIKDVASGIITEIRQRTENFLAIFDLFSGVTSLFFLFIILRVLHYRYKFLTNERFDNRFITNDFHEIDLRRAQLGKETVLPLNLRERFDYVNPSSIKLVRSERVKILKSSYVVLIACFKLSTHMIADYSLYWILMKIRYHSRYQSKLKAPGMPGVHVEGEGFLAKLLKSIVQAFQPTGVNLEIDTIPCLPDPIPPDYDRYMQIVTSLVICWFLTILEPYGLRMRHAVMSYYHPERAKQRAVWLYNHILRSRSSFLKFARRQLRRQFGGDRSIDRVTFMEFVRAHLDHKIFRLFLGSDKQNSCLLCGTVFRPDDDEKFFKCKKPACPGFFCEQCYRDLQNLCTICMEPIEYGDISDISEERDSSEDELTDKFKEGKLKGQKTQKKETDYETDYQNDQPSPLPIDIKRLHRDVEKQSIPDYASMENFRKNYYEKLDHDDLSDSNSSILSDIEDDEVFSKGFPTREEHPITKTEVIFESPKKYHSSSSSLISLLDDTHEYQYYPSEINTRTETVKLKRRNTTYKQQMPVILSSSNSSLISDLIDFKDSDRKQAEPIGSLGQFQESPKPNPTHLLPISTPTSSSSLISELKESDGPKSRIFLSSCIQQKIFAKPPEYKPETLEDIQENLPLQVTKEKRQESMMSSAQLIPGYKPGSSSTLISDLEEHETEGNKSYLEKAERKTNLHQEFLYSKATKEDTSITPEKSNEFKNWVLFFQTSKDDCSCQEGNDIAANFCMYHTKLPNIPKSSLLQSNTSSSSLISELDAEDNAKKTSMFNYIRSFFNKSESHNPNKRSKSRDYPKESFFGKLLASHKETTEAIPLLSPNEEIINSDNETHLYFSDSSRSRKSISELSIPPLQLDYFNVSSTGSPAPPSGLDYKIKYRNVKCEEISECSSNRTNETINTRQRKAKTSTRRRNVETRVCETEKDSSIRRRRVSDYYQKTSFSF